eukprot:12884622-Prorocentrum_lima.AAC.1
MSATWWSSRGGGRCSCTRRQLGQARRNLKHWWRWFGRGAVLSTALRHGWNGYCSSRRLHDGGA